MKLQAVVNWKIWPKPMQPNVWQKESRVKWASALLNKWKETLHGVMYIQIQQLYVIEFLSSLYLVDFLWSENLMKHQLDFTYSTKKLKLPHMTTVLILLLFLGTYFFTKNSLKAHLLLFYRYIWLLLTTGIIREIMYNFVHAPRVTFWV